jgi:hypothetical protein
MRDQRGPYQDTLLKCNFNSEKFEFDISKIDIVFKKPASLNLVEILIL